MRGRAILIALCWAVLTTSAQRQIEVRPEIAKPRPPVEIQKEARRVVQRVVPRDVETVRRRFSTDSLAEVDRLRLERFEGLSRLYTAQTKRDPSGTVGTVELLREGRAAYKESRYKQADLAFRLELSRVAVEARLEAKRAVFPTVLEWLYNTPGPIQSALKYDLIGDAQLEGWVDKLDLRKQYEAVEVRYLYIHGAEPLKWLRRTRARAAAAAMGRDVMVIERTLGSIGSSVQRIEERDRLPDVPPPPDPLEFMRKDKMRGRPGENVFHVVRDHLVDFEFSVVVLNELESKLRSAFAEFTGTVVVSKEAERSGANFRAAFPNALVVYDPGLESAVEGIAAVRRRLPLSSRRTVAVLVPRDVGQQRAMGLTSWSDTQRATAWTSVVKWAQRTRFGQIVTWRSNGFRPLAAFRKLWDQATDREVVLKALADSQEVLVVFAHGSQQWISMPDGSKVTIDDVKALKLTKRPFVVLLSCEGADTTNVTLSFAEALKEVGAAAVYGAEQKLDVHEALAIAERFADARQTQRSLLDVVRELDAQQRKTRSTRMRLKIVAPVLPARKGTTYGLIPLRMKRQYLLEVMDRVSARTV